ARPAPRRGLAIVETAAIASIAFLLIFGVFEYGRFMMVASALENAAREGARYAVLQNSVTQDTATGEAAVVKRAKHRLGPVQAPLSGLTVVATRLDPATGNDSGHWDGARFPEPVSVRVTATYNPVTFVLTSSVPLKAQATMGSEAN